MENRFSNDRKRCHNQRRREIFSMAKGQDRKKETKKPKKDKAK